MKKLRLIMVEDSENDTILLLYQIKKAGYEVEHIRVENAEELSEALESETWYLVISDHALPCFSAPEALSVLNHSGKELPFIIVSSVIGEEVAVTAMKAGAHDYIMKNNLTRLVPIIERTLYDAEVRAERKRVREALRESEVRFRRLAENAQDLIYRVKLIPHVKFEYVSSFIKDLTGYRPEDYYSNPNLCFETIYPEDRYLLEASFRGGISFDSPLILHWYHKNGSMVWIEQRNVGIYDGQGRLLPAISEMVRGFMKRTGINAEVIDNGFSQRLPRPVETALYRCVQESLTNVARHARAQNVTVEFLPEESFLLVNIVDDGDGFELEKQKISADSIGLTGMHERIKLLSGDFRIESSIGRGTRVMIRVCCLEVLMAMRAIKMGKIQVAS